MEKVLWLIEYIRCGLWSFLLDGRPVEIDSDQIKTLIENTQCYTTWGIADIHKISKSSIENHLQQLDYINCFDVWVPHKLKWKKKTFLTIFPHEILYLNIMKMSHFSDGWWKVNTMHNVDWKRSLDKWNEPPPTIPKAGLHSKKVMLCIWWGWIGSPLLFTSSRKPND